MTFATWLRSKALYFALQPDGAERMWLRDLARLEGRNVTDEAHELLFTKAVTRRREYWVGEDLCATIQWLCSYIQEALAAESVTSDDFPPHVIRAMLVKATTLVQDAYKQRALIEERRLFDPLPLRSPVDFDPTAILVQSLARVCDALRRANMTVPGLVPEQLPALQMAAQRWVEQFAPDRTEPLAVTISETSAINRGVTNVRMGLGDG